jgi:hypothetical protein
MFGFTQKYGTGTFASLANLVYAPVLFTVFWIRNVFPVRTGSGSYHKTRQNKLFTNVADPDTEYIKEKIRIRIWDLFDPGSGIGPPSRINLHKKINRFTSKRLDIVSDLEADLERLFRIRPVQKIPDPQHCLSRFPHREDEHKI